MTLVQWLGLLNDFGPQQPAHQCRRDQGTKQLGNDETRQIDRPDAGKGVGKRTRHGDGRIGEGRGRGEPVGGGDVEAYQPWHGGLLEPEAGENDRDQPEGRDRFGEPLRRPGTKFRRDLQHRQGKHEMRRDHPGDAADDLRGQIGGEIAERQLPVQPEHQRDGRIEMRAGDRPKDGDQGNQHGAGRQGVAEQRQRHIMRQRFGHDAGTDHCCDQKTGAKGFGNNPARKIEGCHHAVSIGRSRMRVGAPPPRLG